MSLNLPKDRDGFGKLKQIEFLLEDGRTGILRTIVTIRNHLDTAILSSTNLQDAMRLLDQAEVKLDRLIAPNGKIEQLASLIPARLNKTLLDDFQPIINKLTLVANDIDAFKRAKRLQREDPRIMETLSNLIKINQERLISAMNFFDEISGLILPEIRKFEELTNINGELDNLKRRALSRRRY